MALRNLSIRELSEKSGVGYNNLRLFLLGKVKNPKFITVNKIVSALGITWQDLLEDEDINDLVIAYYDENNKVLEPLETQINVEDKKLTVNTNHFSYYFLVNINIQLF